MRNPERIPVIIERLQKDWAKYPDLRFCQFMSNLEETIKRKTGTSDLFYMEDDKFMRVLDSLPIEKNIEVPTGNILIVNGDKGQLEVVSLGDYGAENNLKADFLGLTRDIEKVESQKIKPLTDKWVVTVSTQYGCYMNCRFCDVPKVKKPALENEKAGGYYAINASYDDLIMQIRAGLSTHPDIKKTNRLNIHYARMGEPTWNPNVIDVAYDLHDKLHDIVGDSLIHPVVSTMMPKHNKNLKSFLNSWMILKNEFYDGDAGLQLSINSTDDNEREIMFNGNSLTLKEISEMVKDFRPVGRKITLNFAIAGYKINAWKLARLFDPKYFVVKLTPMHKTSSALKNGIETDGDYTTMYPYKEIENELKEAGFDVLVFIASEDEDLGRITCGNAILSGTMPFDMKKE